MQKLSGEFLARLLLILQNANERQMDVDELIKNMAEAARSTENLYCETVVNSKSADDKGAHKRLDLLDSASLEKLNAMVPWSSYFNFGGTKTLGTPWSERKRHAPQPFPDRGVEKLNEIVPLEGLSVLELGCYEGHHTVSLARHAAEVWAIDGRIENVIKTLVRVWGAGCEKRATVNCIDLEKGALQDQIRVLGRKKGFDLIHHRGVLYHLSDPVNHVYECAAICNKHFYLHTQIASDDMGTDTSSAHWKTYQVYRYKEPKSSFSPFSGITQQALWLTKQSLMDLLKDAGFNEINIISEVQERNGPRIEMVCSR